MNTIQVFGIIFITASACFFIFQLWYYYENYDYVLRYNNTYKNLEYARTANINSEDKTVYDPNDTEFDANKKWRCAFDQSTSLYYSVSQYGFLSTESTSIELRYQYLNDCILATFSTQVKIVYNACSVPTSQNCLLLTRLLMQ